MNAVQETAFKEGTGSFFTAAQLLEVVQMIGATAVFLYVAWLCLRAYNDFGAGDVSAINMIIVWCRAVFVMMVLLYLLVN